VLKTAIAYIGSFIRKVWNLPSHLMLFMKESWRHFRLQVAPVWKYSEFVEFFQTIVLSFHILISSIAYGWRKLRQHIGVMNRTRFNKVCSGSGSWIDVQLYSGEI